jgi:UDP-N-acetylmuramyl pentapeptide phosphotransferase/UDP-N-acetylglucosamine-1-phosphate transferase
MVIANDFEISYLLVAFALLGIILIGGLLDTLHLRKLHPRLLGAMLGALLGFALIEAVPLFT